MSRECSCGESFETLTRLRLHQRDECPDRAADLDVSDQDLDEIAEGAVRELLVCDICEERNDGVESISHETTDAGLSFVVTFQCDHCGGHNENTAILSGDRA